MYLFLCMHLELACYPASPVGTGPLLLLCVFWRQNLGVSAYTRFSILLALEVEVKH